MREILFRGKRVDNGEWHYGFYREFAVPYPWKIHAYRDGINYYIDAPETNESHLVIPETIGQYTGLKDKNGVKIYEEDILDCGDRIVKVKWNEFFGTWDSIFIKYTGEEKKSNGIGVDEWKFRTKVIGNIHGKEASNDL